MIRVVGKLVGALVVALAVTVSGAWAHCGHCGKGPAAAAKTCCEKHAAGQKQECCEKHAAGQKQACCEQKSAAAAKTCCEKHAAGQKQECCEKHAAGQKQACCEKAAAKPACCAGSGTSTHAEPAPAATLPVAQAPGGAADRTQLSPGMQSLMQKVDDLRRRRGGQ